MRGLEQYQRNAQIQGQPNVEVVPMFMADDDVIVEWRAATVGFLDELLAEVNAMLGLSGSDGLSLAQMLEAGSWKVGWPVVGYAGEMMANETCRAAEKSQKSHDQTRKNRRL